jgi:hypothetical protein
MSRRCYPRLTLFINNSRTEVRAPCLRVPCESRGRQREALISVGNSLQTTI